MNADIGSWIAIVVVIALVTWGLIPRRKHTHPNPAPSKDDPDLARKVGVVTGVMGGGIEDAAVTKYALSRLDKPPTAYDLGVAAGIKASTDSPQRDP